MNPVTIDMEKLAADIAAAEKVVERAKEELDAASARWSEAVTRRQTLERMIDMLRNYAVTPEGQEPSPVIPRPLAGMSGMEASEAYMSANPGAVLKLEFIFDQMKKQGFEGTENAVSVAFANLAKADKVDRVRRGTYRFPGTGNVVELAIVDNVGISDAATGVQGAIGSEARGG